MNKLFSLLVLVFSINVFSEDLIPNSIYGTYVTPSCIESKFNQAGYSICSKPWVDTVDVVKRSTKTVYVNIKVVSLGGGCGFNGIGSWNENSLIATGKSFTDDSYCKIKVVISDNKLNLTEAGGDCSMSHFCSYGDNILNGFTYTKK